MVFKRLLEVQKIVLFKLTKFLKCLKQKQNQFLKQDIWFYQTTINTLLDYLVTKKASVRLIPLFNEVNIM